MRKKTDRQHKSIPYDMPYTDTDTDIDIGDMDIIWIVKGTEESTP
jgi:hypothetical protein